MTSRPNSNRSQDALSTSRCHQDGGDDVLAACTAIFVAQAMQHDEHVPEPIEKTRTTTPSTTHLALLVRHPLWLLMFQTRTDGAGDVGACALGRSGCRGGCLQRV